MIMKLRFGNWHRMILLVSILASISIIACSSVEEVEVTRIVEVKGDTVEVVKEVEVIKEVEVKGDTVVVVATATTAPVVVPPSGPAGSIVIAIGVLSPLIQEPKRDISALVESARTSPSSRRSFVHRMSPPRPRHRSRATALLISDSRNRGKFRPT